MLTLKQLQEEMIPWQAHNFPNRTAREPLLGLVEELGELAHAQLKGAQSIRYTAEEIRAKKADAVADIIVFLADYCNASDLNMWNNFSDGPNVTLAHIEVFATKVGTYKDSIDTIFKIQSDMARVLVDFQGEVPHAITLDSIRWLLMHLCAYCVMEGLDAQAELELTWSKVKQRDWQKHPTDANKQVAGSI